MNGNDIKNIFGASVKELRTAKKLNQEQLAELVGVDKNTITRIETGINFVTCDTYARLSNVFNVHPKILMTQRPTFILDENIDYRKQINLLLQTFSQDKLQEVYNILSVMKK